MTIWNVDIMWALMLFGCALFCGCCVIMNPVLRGVRIMGLGTAYAIGAWMLFALPLRVAVTTWCVFASAGGAFVFAYELWARFRYASTGRRARPLVLLQGFILWPAMVPDAIEGMLVDAGVLPPSWRADGTAVPEPDSTRPAP
jgi:hypothetical protein